MAYYAPFYRPTYYNPMQNGQDLNQFNQQFQQPIAPTPTPQQTGNGLIWVQGEAGAKSYFVAPGNTVMLMDSESERFYLKSADASGMPMPLRIFDYKELTVSPTQGENSPVSAERINLDDFITREEFERRMADIGSGCKCKEKAKKSNLMEETENAEPFV